jgi:hypothetical protein
MSQEFKFKFDRMQENNPASDKEKEDQKSETYATATSSRNLCFVWPDGRKLFLNYAYLISGEYIPTEKNITLIFTTHKIVLKGARLDVLYDDLLMHVPRVIPAIDPRYAEIDEGRFYIEEILVEPLQQK